MQSMSAGQGIHETDNPQNSEYSSPLDSVSQPPHDPSEGAATSQQLHEELNADTEEVNNEVEHITPIPRRSSRDKRIPNRLHDYVCHSVVQHRPSPHALSKVVSYDKLSSSHKAFTMAVTSITEPRTYNQAIKH
nr:Retrovirus-related Pol polyprotein from transposon TNT 1-94 [Ipomoea batatas]